MYKIQGKLRYIGLDEEKMEYLEPIFIRRLFLFLKENKIRERVILKENSKTLSYAKTTKYKFLRSDLIGNTAKIIYLDTVIELVYGEPLYATITTNRELAETSRKQFEVFWSLAHN